MVLKLLQAQGGNVMPQNEEANQRFGFYKDLCLRDEAVVLERKPFSHGPKHRCRTTVWKLITEDKVVRLGKRSDFGSGFRPFTWGEQCVSESEKDKQNTLFKVEYEIARS